MDVLIQMAE